MSSSAQDVLSDLLGVAQVPIHRGIDLVVVTGLERGQGFLMQGDGLIHLERGAHDHVADELELPEEGDQHPLERLVLRGLPQDAMKEDLGRFVDLRRELDPDGVFLNDHLRELFE